MYYFQEYQAILKLVHNESREGHKEKQPAQQYNLGKLNNVWFWLPPIRIKLLGELN